MPYVNIDENRKQINWSDLSENAEIKVDMPAPSSRHTLRTNYNEFANSDQWEIIPTSLETKIKYLEDEIWFKNSKALTDYYNVQYQKIKSYLIEGNKTDALQYLSDLMPVVPEALLPILSNLSTHIQEHF